MSLFNLHYLIPLVTEYLAKGNLVTVTVTGSSMLPFLRHGKDKVVLKRCNYSQVLWGDIVLVRRKNKQYVLHRIVFKQTHVFFICGDAQNLIEGPFYPSQFIARVTIVRRGNQSISCTSFRWKFESVLWWIVFPYRPILLKIASKMKQLKL